jgi:hypothetical protein
MNLLDKQSIELWEQQGRPVPPPPGYKRAVIKEFAQKYKSQVFIETGTFLGDTIVSINDYFGKIYSIELSPDLHQKAVDRFARFGHISILHGDSGTVLPGLMSQISESCLFWLDGHYSWGITAKGEMNTPIRKELETIMAHPQFEKHVILIDDAREFTGNDDYPSIDEVRSMFMNKYPGIQFELKDDIMRIYHP